MKKTGKVGGSICHIYLITSFHWLPYHLLNSSIKTLARLTFIIAPIFPKKNSESTLPSMASKTVASTALLLLSLNLLFFTLVSSNYTPCPPTPKSPKAPVHKSPPAPAPKKPASCPKDTVKLGVCADLLNTIVNVVVGTPAKTPCCTLLSGLADTDAAVCLCTALKAKVLGANLNVPVSLSLLLNYCGKKIPAGYKCA